MAIITIELEDDLARQVEESARREHKSVAEWIKERVRSQLDQATVEAQALANGYPPGWLSLFGSLAAEETFVGPSRGQTRSVNVIDTD